MERVGAPLGVWAGRMGKKPRERWPLSGALSLQCHPAMLLLELPPCQRQHLTCVRVSPCCEHQAAAIGIERAGAGSIFVLRACSAVGVCGTPLPAADWVAQLSVGRPTNGYGAQVEPRNQMVLSIGSAGAEPQASEPRSVGRMLQALGTEGTPHRATVTARAPGA